MDDTGKKFERLTVLSESAALRDNRNKKVRIVVAQCDCGSVKEFRLKNLRTGNTKSCGCLDAENLAKRNAAAARPQEWTIDNGIAWIVLRDCKVLVDSCDVETVGKYRWYMDNTGYVDSMQCAPMHRMLLGLPKGDPREGDHKNHVPWDNRRSNIRVASSSQNKMNRRGNVCRRCEFKGVTKSRGLYKAQIAVSGKRIWIGRFKTEIEAAKAYDAAARKYFGEFACLNFSLTPETG